MDERWAPIEGFENYQVSTHGRVKNLQTGKYLCPTHGTPYLKVKLRKPGIQKWTWIHRLVAKAFIPNPNNYNIVDHRDQPKTNNCVTNLRWCSARQNVVNTTRRARVRNDLPIGVSQRSNGKYRAYIQQNGKRKYLGTFITLIEAALQRLLAEQAEFGEFMPQPHQKRLKALLKST